ncbi:MAG: protein of unknown function with transrane region [Candidatus Taylorbacteria bacterium]|nr:protein of unknown function with transrane region [Candidatus Taylorbacteria bacterium]
MSIITRFLYKIKLNILAHLEEVGVCLIILFVGISSYELGKYSVLEQSPQDGVTFENGGLPEPVSKVATSTPVNTAKVGDKDNGSATQVVASKTGKRYYLPWCGAAQRISDKNKVYFASALDAEKAGLTKASNCKGL